MDQTPATWQAEHPDGWLIVSVDRLPAWMLGPWGATWVPTPTLCRLAAAGLVCDRLLVRSTDPADTLRELRDGRLPGFEAAAEGRRGPLVAAAARGWQLAVVTDVPDQCEPLLEPSPGPEVVVVPPGRPRRTAAGGETSRCGRVIAAVEAVLARGSADLLWCHLGHLGEAWDAPQACREACFDPDDPPPDDAAVIPDFGVTAATDPDRVMAARQVFAGELAHFDDLLGRLLAAAERRWRRFGLLLVGVRGLPLGLHGRVGVGQPEPAPFAELMQVPAVIIDPAGRQAAQRFGGLTLPADLGATVADLIGGVARPRSPAVDPGAGRSLEKILAGNPSAWRAGGRDRIFCRSAGGRAIAVADWSLVESVGGPPRLFAQPDDAFELADVADRCREVAAALAACLDDAASPASGWEKPLPPPLTSAPVADR